MLEPDALTALLNFFARVESFRKVCRELGAEQTLPVCPLQTEELASRGAREATEAASAYSRLWLADGQQIKLMGEGHCCQDCTGLEEARGAICN